MVFKVIRQSGVSGSRLCWDENTPVRNSIANAKAATKCIVTYTRENNNKLLYRSHIPLRLTEGTLASFPNLELFL